jgi:soluble lytic murein transglycosylase-like protein
MTPTLPPPQIEQCIADAADAYHVEAAQLRAIMENGLPAGAEANGRVGPMAIPVQWLPVLELMGIDTDDVRDNACENIFVGAWIVAYDREYRKWQETAQAWAAGPVPKLSASVLQRRRDWEPVVEQIARETGEPAALLDAIISVESSYQPRLVSSAGAIGMMQLMPSTASMLGVNPWDPVENIRGGARYMVRLQDQFNGDLRLALAAYNAGPAAVTRSGYRIPPFPETAAYVPKVLALFNQLASR